MDPLFLDLEEVLAIHTDQIERYGGRLGVRDLGALQSAIAMPAAGIGDTYFHTDIQAMSAAYLYHIVRGHPFVDGNKRAGSVAAIVFLAMNGVDLDADEAEFEALVLRAARGEVEKPEVAAFLRSASSS